MEIKIEIGIQPVCDALNAIDGVITLWSCEGHRLRNAPPYVAFSAPQTTAFLISQMLERYSGRGGEELKYVWVVTASFRDNGSLQYLIKSNDTRVLSPGLFFGWRKRGITAELSRMAKLIRHLFSSEDAVCFQKKGEITRFANECVLMLDIDGVLHPRQSGSLERLPMLEVWLRTNPSVDIVISSNWRDSHSFDDLLNLFSSDLRVRVVGVTRNLPNKKREDEIFDFVRRHAIKNWVAIDDDAAEFPTTAGRYLVSTNYADGLEPKHFMQIEEKFWPKSHPAV
jgi:hypothetical protein